MRLIGLLLAPLVALALSVALASAYFFHHMAYSPVKIGQPIPFRVSPGTSLNEIDTQLHQRGLLPFPKALVLLAKSRGVERDIKAGNYLLEGPSVSLDNLLEKLTSGIGISERLTIIEGSTFSEAIRKIGGNEFLDLDFDPDDPDSVRRALGIEQDNPEGLLYPDTYLFQESTSGLSLLKLAHKRMIDFLNQEWSGRKVGLPFESPYEALILASVVQKEAASLEEMDVIASVFINRLNKGMRLQADPTVIYGMGASYQGNITKKDLRTDTPYNTYTRGGLPPTPIALPSPPAIKAALNPADTSYYYFVADREGERHLFSRTLREHINAVNKHQK